MRDLRVVFFRGRGPFAALIRWFTRGNYAHVGILDRSTNIIYEAREFRGVVASHHGVRVAPGALYRFANPLTAEEEEKVLAFLIEQLGKRYDYLSVLMFVLRLPFGPRDRWFCSELVAEALLFAGRVLLFADSAELAPEHLSWSKELELEHHIC